MRECVAAFIVKDGKILFGRRSETRPFYPNIWDVFGGHVKEGESREDALRRELAEELGIVWTDSKFLLTVDEPNPEENGLRRYHFYLVSDFDGEPRNLQPEEHVLIEWFEFEQALRLPFAQPLYAELIERIFEENNENTKSEGYKSIGGPKRESANINVLLEFQNE